jgi:nucleoside-diphosphate-sugar epimerase
MNIVLVTGGAGYVGSHLVRKLLARGRHVRVLDRFLYGDHGLIALLGDPALEVFEADVRDRTAVLKAARGADAVIALAALVGDAACDLNPAETASINLDSTRLIAEVCDGLDIGRLVFASSCSVYGAGGDEILTDTSELAPVSLYAQTRIDSEAILDEYRDRLGVVILRLATVFGLSPRMRLDLLVNTFASQAFFNGRIRVFGGGQWRPNLHVQDAASAFMLAAEVPDAIARGQIFNVGDNSANHTVLDVARMVHTALPDTAVEVTDSVTDQRNYRVSFDKINQQLGYRARFGVADGIAEIVAACRDRRISGLNDPRYSNIQCLKLNAFGRGRSAPTTAAA